MKIYEIRFKDDTIGCFLNYLNYLNRYMATEKEIQNAKNEFLSKKIVRNAMDVAKMYRRGAFLVKCWNEDDINVILEELKRY